MTIDEQSLRDLLASAYQQRCLEEIQNCFQKSEQFTVEMGDGSKIISSTWEEARSVLQQRFHCQGLAEG